MRGLRAMLALGLALAAGLVAPAPAGEVLRDVAVGPEAACALYRSGSVWCWGNLPGRPLALPFTAWEVTGLPPASALSVGSHTACAIARDGGALWCWGVDLQRSIRAGGAIVAAAPVRVSGLPPVRSVSLGYMHLCAIARADGAPWCLGANSCGEIGCGDTRDHADPVRLGAVGEAIAVSAGVRNSCAVLVGGAVACWGSDDPGGTRADAGGFVFSSPTPLRFDPEVVGRFRAVANGQNFACGLRRDGRVSCWGSNLAGQLGTAAPRIGAPQLGIGEVEGIAAARALDATLHGACALEAGAVKCWGRVAGGGPGAGPGARTVPGLAPVSALGVGAAFSCAVAGGAVRCWGAAHESLGPLLPGMAPDRPVPVPGLP